MSLKYICKNLRAAEQMLERVDNFMGFPRPGRWADTGEIRNGLGDELEANGDQSGWTFRYGKVVEYSADPDDEKMRPAYLKKNEVEIEFEDNSGRNVPIFFGVPNISWVDVDFNGNKLIQDTGVDIAPGVRRYAPEKETPFDSRRMDVRDQPHHSVDIQAIRDKIYPSRRNIARRAISALARVFG